MTQELAVVGEHRLVAGAEEGEQTGRALDVGKDEGDGSLGQLSHGESAI